MRGRTGRVSVFDRGPPLTRAGSVSRIFLTCTTCYSVIRVSISLQACRDLVRAGEPFWYQCGGRASSVYLYTFNLTSPVWGYKVPKMAHVIYCDIVKCMNEVLFFIRQVKCSLLSRGRFIFEKMCWL